MASVVLYGAVGGKVWKMMVIQIGDVGGTYW